MRLPPLRATIGQALAGTAVVFLLAGCGTSVADALSDDLAVETGDTAYDAADAATITLSGTSASWKGDAVAMSDGTLTISAAGTYVLSGDTSGEAPTGALYSTADLTIGGSGSLSVTGNTNNGIVGKDGLVITGGTIDVTSVDDGILGKDYLVLTDGIVTVDSVGDAFKSSNTEDAGAGFVLAEGAVEVTGSYEAMEGSLIIIDDGDIELHSADDGVDSHGNATITDGEIVVYGPTTAGHGALDVNGTFEVSGGTLLAVGSSGMMVAPSTDSAQGWIATALASTAAAGSKVVITDDSGASVATYAPGKDFASVVFSSSDTEPGSTYAVTVGGTASTVTAGEAPAGGQGGPGGPMGG